MARGERTCIVCGTKYVYCPNCKKGYPDETWRYLYDSEECREIYKVCNHFSFGHIDAEEAGRKLEKYNVTDRSKYSEDIRKNLSAIYAAKAETSKAKEAPVEKKEEAPAPKEEPRRRERKLSE